MTHAKQQLQEAKREKGDAEQQASALTGSLGYDKTTAGARIMNHKTGWCIKEIRQGKGGTGSMGSYR